MSRLLRPSERDDGEFDREYWMRVGLAGKLDAMWDLVNEYRKLKGLPGREPRLRRTVVRLVRRAV